MDGESRVEVARRDAPACVHHWVLSDPAAGPVTGRCRRCGGERVFPVGPETIARLEIERRERRVKQSAEPPSAERMAEQNGK